MELDDMERLPLEGAKLERTIAQVFADTRAGVVGRAAPISMTPAPAPAPYQPNPPGPSYGFHNPAPKSAPKLEAEIVDPEVARARLLKLILALRTFAHQMHNVSRLVSAIADLLEHGTTKPLQPRGTHGHARSTRS